MSVQDKVVRSSEEHPYLVLILVALVTVTMIFGVTQISMSSEMEGFLPEDYTSVKVTNEIENDIGGARSETIFIEGENLASVRNLKAVVGLKSDLAQRDDFDNYIKKIHLLRNSPYKKDTLNYDQLL